MEKPWCPEGILTPGLESCRWETEMEIQHLPEPLGMDTLDTSCSPRGWGRHGPWLPTEEVVAVARPGMSAGMYYLSRADVSHALALELL